MVQITHRWNRISRSADLMEILIPGNSLILRCPLDHKNIKIKFN